MQDLNQGTGSSSGASIHVFDRELCEEIGLPTLFGTRLGRWYEPVIDGDSFTAVVECPGAPPSLGNDPYIHGSCDQCPRGRYDDDLDGSTECMSCPSGQYSHEPGAQGNCTHCPLGTLSLEGAMDASQCNMLCDVNGTFNYSFAIASTHPTLRCTCSLARRIHDNAHPVREHCWRPA